MKESNFRLEGQSLRYWGHCTNCEYNIAVLVAVLKFAKQKQREIERPAGNDPVLFSLEN